MKFNTALLVCAIIVLLMGGGIGWFACDIFTPDCAEVVGQVVTRDTITAPVPDGRTIKVVGVKKVKPIAKIAAKPANGLIGGMGYTYTPTELITPPEVTIDSTGNVEIPITDKEYITAKYKAVVRGYMPELRSLELYTESTTITVRKPPRWALTVGPGASYTPNGFEPAISVTLGFVIWSK